jgi:general secretion pathway protein D
MSSDKELPEPVQPSVAANHHRSRRRPLVAALFCCALAAASMAAEPPRITLNMRNADIGSVLEWLAETSGKRVVIDPRVRGTVTILARDPMTADEAFRVVIASLGVYGYAAIDQGDVLAIVPAANVRTGATRFLESLDENSADLPVNEVIRLGFLPAEQMASTLKPMMPPQAGIVALPGQNALLITDVASGVKRISRIARELDNSGSMEFDAVALQHAAAPEMLKVLEGMLGKNAGAGLQLVADERSNSILLAGPPEMRAKVRELVSRLDQPQISEGSIQVVYLHYLKASEMVPLLKGILEQKDAKGAPTKTAAVSIESSDSTNALVINAPPDRLQDVMEVIRKLDIRRAQVLVEAIIAEVDENVARELSVEWKTAFNGDGTEAISRFPGGQIQGGASALDNVGAGLTLGYFRNGSLRAVVQALEKTGNSNILSTPSIVTLDNQEAEILVGSNVPFKTGEATSGGAPVTNPFTTIARQDIGVTLKVKPQINQGDAITLDILQTVETLTDSTAAEDVVTDKRSVHTSVMLGDQDILVLGGLTENKRVKSVSKIPFLGDLPLLGALFRSTTDKVDRRNLMVFVRTRILTDMNTAEQETRDRYNAIRELQQAPAAPLGGPLAPASAPLLPELPAAEKPAQ